MNPNIRSWQDLEKRVCSLFAEAGFIARHNVKIQGIRAVHQIDVLLTCKIHGIQFRTVIECKHWKARVSKEKVAALKTIMDDVGAEKGMIVSKAGFQAGARNQAQKTNIDLVLIDDLIERAATFKYECIKTKVNSRVESLHKRLKSLCVSAGPGQTLEDGRFAFGTLPIGDLFSYADLCQMLGNLHIFSFRLEYHAPTKTYTYPRQILRPVWSKTYPGYPDSELDRPVFESAIEYAEEILRALDEAESDINELQRKVENWTLQHMGLDPALAKYPEQTIFEKNPDASLNQTRNKRRPASRRR